MGAECTVPHFNKPVVNEDTKKRITIRVLSP